MLSPAADKPAAIIEKIIGTLFAGTFAGTLAGPEQGAATGPGRGSFYAAGACFHISTPKIRSGQLNRTAQQTPGILSFRQPRQSLFLAWEDVKNAV